MTVRDGHNRGHLMVVVRDCVGTYTEDGHNAALKRIERFADVVGVETTHRKSGSVENHRTQKFARPSKLS